MSHRPTFHDYIGKIIIYALASAEAIKILWWIATDLWKTLAGA